MLNEPCPQSKALVEVVAIASTETDGRFVRLDFDAPIAGSRALPGQFFEVSSHGRDELGNPVGNELSPLLNRPFSIHRRTDTGFSILVEIVGLSSRRLAALRAGDRVRIIGPLGQGMKEIAENVKGLVLVAGGVGVAPFTAFAQFAREKQIPCWLYYGVNSPEDLALRISDQSPFGCVLLDEFTLLGCRCSLASMLDDTFFHGTVVDLLERDYAERRGPFEEGFGKNLLVGCGPWVMHRALAKWSLERGLETYLLLEEMMGCGIGICRSCVIPGFDIDQEGRKVKRNLAVCRDGPMISADRVDWERDWS